MSDRPCEEPAAPGDTAPEPGPGDAEFRRALTIVRESREASEKRIAALRAAVASGAYKPDPHEIARKILEHGL
jgi:hypothetical protein